MNNEEIQKEITNIQNAINILIEKQNELKKSLSISEEMRPRIEGIRYYYIDTTGNIQKSIERLLPVSDWLYTIGNYFKTEQEAKEYKNNLITKQKLKDLALKLNDEIKIDWKNNNQRKYYIYYDHSIEKLKSMNIVNSQDLNQIYCLDEQFLHIAIKKIGKEKLIELIKSGV